MMSWAWRVVCAALLLATRSAFVEAADSVVVVDAETGFTFSQFSAKYNAQGAGQYILYRVAIPSTAQEGSPYDAVVQITAPANVGWAGLSWGGTMINHPLSVAWRSGSTTIISSRMATQHVMPQPYSGATYEILPKGTHANYTHWQVTARCTGCTRDLRPKRTNRMAFAQSNSGPSNPSSAQSTFPIHDVTNAWDHDFNAAGNPQFASLVAKNGGRA